MNGITQAEASMAAGYTAATSYGKAAQNTKAAKESQAAGTESAKKTKYTNGRTIGEPELSEKALKYYEQLRKKYSNMDFILVSKDMKQMAQANAGKYANPNRMVVLIDEEKIERMATDEQYRKQYEAIISNAPKKLSQIKDSLGMNAGSVKSYGMQVNDGGNASFFAVIDKSLAAQRDRIEKKAQQKAEQKKKDKKAAEKERMEENRAKKTEDKKKAEGYGSHTGKPWDEDTVTVTANSVEELIRKIQDTIFMQRSDYARTAGERQVGQNFNFAI